MEKHLTKLGLTSLEAKTYTNLLKHGPLSAKEIAQKVGVGNEAVYRLLNSLIKKGLINVHGKRPQKYQAIPLATSVSNLLSQYQAIVNKILNNIDLPQDYPWQVITNRENYHKIGNELFKKVHKEVLVLASGTGDLAPEFTKTMRDAIKKGAVYKIIGQTTGKPNLLQIKNWQRNGFLVRQKAGKGINLVVYDREKVQIGFRVAEGTKEKTGLVISNPSLAKFMSEFYDFLWKTANKI